MQNNKEVVSGAVDEPKKWPERIWLQHDGEGGGFVDEATWCAESINATDIEYVRADLASQPTAAVSDEREAFNRSVFANKHPKFLAVWTAACAWQRAAREQTAFIKSCPCGSGDESCPGPDGVPLCCADKKGSQ